jgi:hypothetical protein
MKQKYSYLLSVLFAATVLGACSGSEDAENTSDSGLVPVTIQMSGLYNSVSSRVTSSELSTDSIFTLGDGSTLWLLSTTGSTTTYTGYLVRTSSSGTTSLYKCPSTTSGNIVSIDTLNASTEPLYLAKGTYTFSSISPALPYNTSTTKKFMVTNNQYVVASNNNYTQTAATNVTIGQNDNEKIVVLNPMLEVGARMKFTIVKGSNVSTISVIQSGIEVDGLGEDPTTYNYNVGDELSCPIGNPYNRLFVKSGFKETTTTVDGATKDCITASLPILPVDCRSTMVYVILNVLINGVPAQYTFAVKNRYFQPAYSYDYTITLSVVDGITVANWDENSWTYTQQ